MNDNSTPRKGKTYSEAGKLGAIASIPFFREQMTKKVQTYLKSPAFCPQCKQPHPYEKRHNKFCSSTCSANFHNRARYETKLANRALKSLKACAICNNDFFSSKSTQKCCSRSCDAQYKRKSYIDLWLEGSECGYGKNFLLSNYIRNYLLDLANHQCTKCGWREINPVTQKVPLEINHKDGNPANAHVSNLEVVCPNCHSLTPNFRALNRNSPRER
jgi:hypothetical protein